ncbi:hypothetical protein Sme01_47050 [Sphaerisporangium melleum]|uniref:Uncharacterized protein n=1 Tax=Sphaerisporangium melleum TaxID=321316 RepID=A0A917RDG0_9ACTN|nr:hypothetical protein GCM10007964_50460 [Sphaerisporangium melleum]GII72229.1 hypothetical protein Sme01_47050 [Sphaerisporangium melleum]
MGHQATLTKATDTSATHFPRAARPSQAAGTGTGGTARRALRRGRGGYSTISSTGMFPRVALE